MSVGNVIQVCRYTAVATKETFDVPHPKGCRRSHAKTIAKDTSEKVLRIASHLGSVDDPDAGAKLVAKLKKKETTTFEHSMGQYLEDQDKIKLLETTEGSLDAHLKGVRRTRLHSTLLAKVLRCARHLKRHDKLPKMGTKKVTLTRYKMGEVSFSLERSGDKLKAIIIHLKKKPKGDFKAIGGMARVTKAVKFTEKGWVFLAERCDYTFEKRKTKIGKDYKSDFVIPPPLQFNHEYYGRRKVDTEETTPSTSSEQSAPKKAIIKKNTSLMEFHEIDLEELVFGHKTWMTKARLKDILCKVAQGLLAMHKAGDANCDLKLENIVLSFDNKKNVKKVKIIDLDISTSAKAIENIKKMAKSKDTKFKGFWAGSDQYWPSNYAKHPQDIRADVYAFGQIITFMLEMASSMTEGDKKPFRAVEKSCKLLTPSKRPTAKKLVNSLKAIAT
ncbi:MAG: hypothetical protein S4CHLAM37_06560 [Chlamydiia bacterium]|nr:hypothetical protein [Chlamydiia bacterium]